MAAVEAPSIWSAVTAPAPPLTSLVGGHDADVIVIGAGLTGLSAALHLRRLGRDVTVIEAAVPGHGASGRNNGQVIPTLTRRDPDDIVRYYGETGERFVALLRDSASALFELMREEGIDAEAEQTGWVQPVHTPGRMKLAEKRAAQWARWGAPAHLLTRSEMVAKLGSDAWHGGWWNPTGGHVNPLALTRGLVARVIARGGRVFAGTPALAINRTTSHWIVTTTQGRVCARALVLATNAYTGAFSRRLAPEIMREVVPVLSWQMATQPISGNLRRSIMPERSAMSDTHGELYFMRYDRRHRLITGGALVSARNGAERLKPYIAARLKRLYPEIGDIAFDYVWNGYVGMTRDGLPRMHRLGPDGYAWAGCNGRALALSVSLGRELARGVCGTPSSELALPLRAPDPIPMHRLVSRVAPLRLLDYKRRDRRELR